MLRSVVLKRFADNLKWLSEALATEAQNGGSIDEAVDGGHSGGLGGEEVSPLAEAGVRGKDDGALTVSGRDDAEQEVGSVRGEGVVPKLIKQQQCRFLVALECAFVGSVGLGSVKLGGGKTRAYVKVNLRLVDTTTGKILGTANADGTATGKSKAGGAYVKGFDLHGSGAKQEPLGKACQDAIDQAVAFVIKHMGSVPFYARVAEIDGGDIYVNAGTNRNMKPDMVLHAYKVKKEIKDPDTGLVIEMIEEKTGSVKITSVKEKISIATKTEGSITKGQKLRMD